MRRAHGYATIVEPGRPTVEIDTLQCGHCQRIVFTKAGTAATVYLLPISPVTTETVGHYQEEPGAFCRVCMRPICLPCHDLGRCHPWEQQIEAAESRERFLQSAGIRD